MGLFQNLFACFCSEPQKQDDAADEVIKYFKIMHTEMKGIANAIGSDIKHVFKQQENTNSDLKRLEDKISANVLQLNTKLDNMILIASRPK